MASLSLGPLTLLLFSVLVFQSTVIVRFVYLPRLKHNLDHAEARNRAKAGIP